jgi:TetR/AcrR family transcriptional regulator, regulator of autoinduction and epiphytic fitness
LGLEDYRRSVSTAKRASILKAARDVFLKDGYSRAAVASIARLADVSTATLYKHFASKEELFAAVAKEAATAVGDYKDVVPPNASAREVFRMLSRTYITTQFDNHVNDLMRIIIAEVPSHPALAGEMADLIVTRRYDSLQSVIDVMVKSGLLRPHNTALSAKLASGMIKEVFVWPALFNPAHKVPPDADAKIDAAADLFLARYGA